MKNQIQKDIILNKNLALTGMMGVGKSTIGKNLAKKLKYKFIDIDKLIEMYEGTSISLIFKNKSEQYFRKIESEITLSELKKEKSVISLGGGAFLNTKIRREVLKNHISFYLNCSSQIILERIRNSKKRPLGNRFTDNELVDLMKKRSNIYSKALYEIKCDNLTKKQIVNKILKLNENN